MPTGNLLITHFKYQQKYTYFKGLVGAALLFTQIFNIKKLSSNRMNKHLDNVFLSLFQRRYIFLISQWRCSNVETTLSAGWEEEFLGVNHSIFWLQTWFFWFFLDFVLDFLLIFFCFFFDFSEKVYVIFSSDLPLFRQSVGSHFKIHFLRLAKSKRTFYWLSVCLLVTLCAMTCGLTQDQVFQPPLSIFFGQLFFFPCMCNNFFHTLRCLDNCR